MKKNTIRIVAIVLAALMLIGVFAGAIINSFAIDGASAVIPSSGERSKIIPVIVAISAVIVVGVCLAAPKIKNRFSKAAGDENNGQI